MPLTEQQLAANRANAKLSRGPKTPGGKLNSSRNATTHGFLAHSILIPGESRAKFLKLLAELTTEFEPSTPDQHSLVEIMAVARWRRYRAWTIEAASLAYEQNRMAGATAAEDPPTRTMLAFRSLTQQPHNLDTLSRHESRFDRQYHRAADRLMRLKEKKQERSREYGENKQVIE